MIIVYLSHMDSTIFNDMNRFILEVALPETFRWLVFLAVLWVPLILLPIAWQKFTKYTRKTWLLKQKHVVMEIKLPAETFKSPAAMELVLNSLYQTGGEGMPLDRYWDGKARPWCSLEIACINGEVRFFIWAFENQKDFISAALYASYPEVTVHEIEDYTLETMRNLKDYDVFACEYKFVKPDPYPIKTYVDYGLDKNPDEELKVDPLSSFIELLGSIKKEDQIWFQFIVRAHKAEHTIFNNKLPDDWVLEAKEEVEKILKDTIVEDKDGKKAPNLVKLSEAKKDQIKALEKSITKLGFDVGIRSLNFIPKGRGGFSIGIIKGGLSVFSSNEHNGFRPSAPEFDYPWQDMSGKIVAKWTGKLVESFVTRSYFHPPYTEMESFHFSLHHVPGLSHFFPSGGKNKRMILNTEELATVFHLPGSTVRTPALKRIPSKRGDAPSNLPI